MAIRKILYANDPRLRQKAKKVKHFGPHLKKLVDDMLETMHHASGVGLAGPQIGVMQRIFVAEIPVDEENPHPDSGKPFVLINPEFTWLSEEMEEGQEGCLSIPNWQGLVNRAKCVTVKAKTIRGKTIKLNVDGFLARVFQHENDHLDGILFIDHIRDKENLWQVLPEDQVAQETTQAQASEVTSPLSE